jgi:hypothetical protein
MILPDSEADHPPCESSDLGMRSFVRFDQTRLIRGVVRGVNNGYTSLTPNASDHTLGFGGLETRNARAFLLHKLCA